MSDDELLDPSATYVLDDESDETKTLEQLAEWAQRNLLEGKGLEREKPDQPASELEQAEDSSE
jgi:hypothetical protein